MDALGFVLRFETQGESECPEHGEHLVELEGRLTGLQLHNETSADTCHTCQIFLKQALTLPGEANALAEECGCEGLMRVGFVGHGGIPYGKITNLKAPLGMEQGQKCAYGNKL